LRFSKQAFYQWRGNPVSQRDWDDAHLTNAAWDAHQDDPAFGYRFISDELNQAGLKAGENRVWRLCSQQQLWSVFAKKRGLRGKAGPPVHDDHVQQNFTATRPTQLWLTDITEHRTAWIQGISATPLALRGRSNVAISTIEETEPTVLGIRQVFRGPIVGAQGTLDRATHHPFGTRMLAARDPSRRRSQTLRSA
jgi:transposase InsO family protein